MGGKGKTNGDQGFQMFGLYILGCDILFTETEVIEEERKKGKKIFIKMLTIRQLWEKQEM